MREARKKLGIDLIKITPAKRLHITRRWNVLNFIPGLI